MKKLLILLLLFFAGKASSQTGINTTNVNSTLTVNGSFQAKYIQVTSSYSVTGTEHYISYTGAANATFTLPTIGTGNASFAGRIYRIKNLSASTVTLVASNGNLFRSSTLTGDASFVIPAAHYVEIVNNANTSGGTWDISFLGDTEVTKQDDATRFLGGTVYVRFATTSGGMLGGGTVISGNYAVGVNNTSVSPSAGGINSVKGSGYKISNPSSGIFDIKFNTPFTQIYGVSVNVLDAYDGSTDIPDPTRSGSRLLTTDNAQVAFIANDILRIKTGNGTGISSNRPFTFLVTGQ